VLDNFALAPRHVRKMSRAAARRQEGSPEAIFGATKEERTRAFLRRIIEAGRL
jgi:ABC-type polar amino acid transport system ATPase subunit